jgi:xylose isomerase
MTLFSEVPHVRYEGSGTTNEFAYRVYEKECLVLNRHMEDWLRIAGCLRSCSIIRAECRYGVT